MFGTFENKIKYWFRKIALNLGWGGQGKNKVWPSALQLSYLGYLLNNYFFIFSYFCFRIYQELGPQTKPADAPLASPEEDDITFADDDDQL